MLRTTGSCGAFLRNVVRRTPSYVPSNVPLGWPISIFTTSTWCPPVVVSPRTSSHVLHPLPPQMGGNESVTMRTRSGALIR
jgi:hypothetical protein